ncbi:hypothetical protein [Gracilimonas sp.]|uniref:hypothetical protein n=1 Tax=Gracilimonas sp. TaxID=1974203 RepID=UPI002871762A|nr:hypothetical protein [Gracilimonas sp.]
MYLLFKSSLKTNKFLLVITIALVSISCTNETTKISYEADKSLEPNKVSVDGGEILYPSGLDVLNSNLLIIDGKLDSSKFKFFDLESFDLITSFGKQGRGPKEFSDIILSPVSTTVNDEVQIFDWSKNILSDMM